MDYELIPLDKILHDQDKADLIGRDLAVGMDKVLVKAVLDYLAERDLELVTFVALASVVAKRAPRS